MRIATWNIGGALIKSSGEEYDLEDLEYFANSVKELNIDILCIQEAHSFDHHKQVKEFAEMLDFQFASHAIAPSHIVEDAKLCLGIVSKYPILNCTFHLLPTPDLELEINGETQPIHDKGILEVVIEMDGKKIRVLSGHMIPFRKLGHTILEEGFADVREALEETFTQSSRPTIAGIDLNYDGDFFEVVPEMKGRFTSILKDYQPTTPRGRAYDKIVVSSDFVIGESEIVKGKADHYLCWAEITIH